MWSLDICLDILATSSRRHDDGAAAGLQRYTGTNGALMQVLCNSVPLFTSIYTKFTIKALIYIFLKSVRVFACLFTSICSPVHDKRYD